MTGSGGTPPSLLSHQVFYTAALAILYAGSFGLVVYVLNPLQAMLLPDVTPFASLLFIPHGLRVIATIVMGARAIPGLFIGALYSTHFIWGITNVSLVMVIALISSTVAWATLACLRALRVNAFYLTRNMQMPAFRTVLLAGIICSIVNGFLMSAVFEVTGNIERVTLTMAAYALGDTLGLIACWALARWLVRLCRIPA